MINTIPTQQSSILNSFKASLAEITDEQKLQLFEKLGTITDSNDGKIIKDENEEVIKVELSSYKMLLAYCGGWTNLLMLNLVMLAFVLCKIKTDYTIGLWARDQTVQHDKF